MYNCCKKRRENAKFMIAKRLQTTPGYAPLKPEIDNTSLNQALEPKLESKKPRTKVSA
jgi:hypothetical protein